MVNAIDNPHGDQLASHPAEEEASTVVEKRSNCARRATKRNARHQIARIVYELRASCALNLASIVEGADPLWLSESAMFT
jgi:hypothetical protein